jgi:hypothetical protein
MLGSVGKEIGKVERKKPGGRIVVIDFYKKDLPVGPRFSMKLSEAGYVFFEKR